MVRFAFVAFSVFAGSALAAGSAKSFTSHIYFNPNTFFEENHASVHEHTDYLVGPSRYLNDGESYGGTVDAVVGVMTSEEYDANEYLDDILSDLVDAGYDAYYIEIFEGWNQATVKREADDEYWNDYAEAYPHGKRQAMGYRTKNLYGECKEAAVHKNLGDITSCDSNGRCNTIPVIPTWDVFIGDGTQKLTSILLVDGPANSGLTRFNSVSSQVVNLPNNYNTNGQFCSSYSSTWSCPGGTSWDHGTSMLNTLVGDYGLLEPENFEYLYLADIMDASGEGDFLGAYEAVKEYRTNIVAARTGSNQAAVNVISMSFLWKKLNAAGVPANQLLWKGEIDAVASADIMFFAGIPPGEVLCGPTSGKCQPFDNSANSLHVLALQGKTGDSTDEGELHLNVPPSPMGRSFLRLKPQAATRYTYATAVGWGCDSADWSGGLASWAQGGSSSAQGSSVATATVAAITVHHIFRTNPTDRTTLMNYQRAQWQTDAYLNKMCTYSGAHMLYTDECNRITADAWKRATIT